MSSARWLEGVPVLVELVMKRKKDLGLSIYIYVWLTSGTLLEGSLARASEAV